MWICFVYPVQSFVCSFNLVNCVIASWNNQCTSMLLLLIRHSRELFGASHSMHHTSNVLSYFQFSFLCYTSQILLLMHLLSLSWHLLFNSSIVKYLFLEVHFMLRVHVWYVKSTCLIFYKFTFHCHISLKSKW